MLGEAGEGTGWEPSPEAFSLAALPAYPTSSLDTGGAGPSASVQWPLIAGSSVPCKAALRGSQSHIWASGGRLGTPHFVLSSLYLKSLRFDKEQVAALTEANEVLKKQIEELQQEATRYAGAGRVLAGRRALAVSRAGPPSTVCPALAGLQQVA